MIDWFAVLWLSVIGIAAAFQIAWLIRGLRTGIATIYFEHDFSRADSPFKFWMILAGRAIGSLIAAAMFVFGLHFFWSLPQ